jgi:superfamily II DNA or RNA helicase
MPFPPRQCQIDAFNCVKERVERGELETNLSLCTGAGKTHIIHKCSLEIPGINRVVLIFPSLLLLRQYASEMRGSYPDVPIYYYATEGTLPTIPRLGRSMDELLGATWCLWTTYISAAEFFPRLTSDKTPDLVIHDEAHHVTAPQYSAALAKLEAGVRRINLSATLPDSKIPHYKYPLLKGIRDGVVRDFNLDLFLCVETERTLGGATALLALIVRKLLTHHTKVKLLIYTREANTTGGDASSVRTFLDAHAVALRAHGWWIEGIRPMNIKNGQ